MVTNDLNRGELLKNLKDKCKSIVKSDFYVWLIVWIMASLLLIFSWSRQDNPMNIFYIVLLIAVVCFGGWAMVLHFRYLKKVDIIETPDRLLYWFVKRNRYLKSKAQAIPFICILAALLIKRGFDFEWFAMAIGVLTFALVFYCGAPWLYRKERDIIKQLLELVEKK